MKEASEVNRHVKEFGDYDLEREFEKKAKGKHRLVIVAYYDGEPAGYIVGYDQFGDRFYCWMTGVDPKFRKKGILKAMMDYQEKWVKKKGYNKIRIKTRNNRREMLSFLVKYGFDIIDMETRDNVKDNRIIFQKVIS